MRALKVFPHDFSVHSRSFVEIKNAVTFDIFSFIVYRSVILSYVFECCRFFGLKNGIVKLDVSGKKLTFHKLRQLLNIKQNFCNFKVLDGIRGKARRDDLWVFTI